VRVAAAVTGSWGGGEVEAHCRVCVCVCVCKVMHRGAARATQSRHTELSIINAAQRAGLVRTSTTGHPATSQTHAQYPRMFTVVVTAAACRYTTTVVRRVATALVTGARFGNTCHIVRPTHLRFAGVLHKLDVTRQPAADRLQPLHSSFVPARHPRGE
jgi:hypothetical protein